MYFPLRRRKHLEHPTEKWPCPQRWTAVTREPFLGNFVFNNAQRFLVLNLKLKVKRAECWCEINKFKRSKQLGQTLCMSFDAIAPLEVGQRGRTSLACRLRIKPHPVVGLVSLLSMGEKAGQQVKKCRLSHTHSTQHGQHTDLKKIDWEALSTYRVCE